MITPAEEREKTKPSGMTNFQVLIICIVVLALFLILVAGIWAFRQRKAGKKVEFGKIRYWKTADLHRK